MKKVIILWIVFIFTVTGCTKVTWETVEIGMKYDNIVPIFPEHYAHKFEFLENGMVQIEWEPIYSLDTKASREVPHGTVYFIKHDKRGIITEKYILVISEKEFNEIVLSKYSE